MTTTGQQIRDARERAGLTQEQLAQSVGVTHRTVGNWERGASVPRNRLAKVRAVLPDLGAGDDGNATLRSASDAEVLAEIARRFARSDQEGSGEHVRSASNRQAPASGATDDQSADREGADGGPNDGSGPPGAKPRRRARASRPGHARTRSDVRDEGRTRPSSTD